MRDLTAELKTGTTERHSGGLGELLGRLLTTDNADSSTHSNGEKTQGRTAPISANLLRLTPAILDQLGYCPQGGWSAAVPTAQPPV